MTDAADILSKSIETFRKSQSVYKNNCVIYGKVMDQFFPNGITLNDEFDHHRFHLFMLAVVKLTRYAVQWENGHPDSLRDASVYLAMLEAYDDANISIRHRDNGIDSQSLQKATGAAVDH